MVFSKKINDKIVLFGLEDQSPMIELSGDLVTIWTQLESSEVSRSPSQNSLHNTLSTLLDLLKQYQMFPEGHSEESMRSFFSNFPEVIGEWKILEMFTPVEVAASTIEDEYGTCSWAGYGEPPFHTYLCPNK